MSVDPIITIGFVLITLLLAAATVLSVRRLVLGRTGGAQAEWFASGAATAICAALLGYRTATARSWAPLHNHADGLLLMTGLLGVLLIYLLITGRLRGLELFIQPIAAVLALWGVCASWWSFKPFTMMSIWTVMHLFCVYVGMGAVTLAAGAGALYLYVQRQLHHTDHPAARLSRLGRLASLERIEKTVVAMGTIGFALVTVAMVTGLITELHQGNTYLGDPWWLNSKVILAAVAWAVYAVIVHVHFAPTFRGARAAVLSIVGFLLLLIVLSIALTMSGCADVDGRILIGSDPTVYDQPIDPPPSSR